MKTILTRAGLCLAVILCSCCGPSREEFETMEKAKQDMVQQGIVMSMEPNTEEYATVKESGYLSAVKTPYSTFSIDVDAASYTTMRRMINQGTLPPPDAVRVEEWINYFNYTYPQPKNEDPFSITTEYAQCPWNSQHKLLHIGLKGREVVQEDAPANNLVFLIDASGSMEDPDKLPLLKRAFKVLLPQLRDKDKISIVTYAGSAGLILDEASGDDQQEILDALENLQAGGSTAGGEGIHLAYEVAKEHFIKKGNNRVILATDGDFNVGVSSPAELEKLVEEKRNDGIYLSVLGFGQGNTKDNKMEVLADKGNGNYNYIDNFMEARKVLVNQFGGTLQTIAKDVKLQVEFNPAYVKEYRLIGYENRRLNAEDFNDDKKDAGELGAGHSVTALYEIVPAGGSETHVNIDDLKYQKTINNAGNNNELANIKFRYKAPGKNDTTSKLIQRPVYNLIVPNDKTSSNFRLASAVTEFAMLVRDSEYKSKASFEDAMALAEQTLQNDKDGYVGEMIRLIRVARDLKKVQ